MTENHNNHILGQPPSATKKSHQSRVEEQSIVISRHYDDTPFCCSASKSLHHSGGPARTGDTSFHPEESISIRRTGRKEQHIDGAPRPWARGLQHPMEIFPQSPVCGVSAARAAPVSPFVPALDLDSTGPASAGGWAAWPEDRQPKTAAHPFISPPGTWYAICSWGHRDGSGHND